MKQDSKPDPNSQSAMVLMLEVMAKKRWRTPQWVKDWAVVHGIKLRARGRPRKTK